MNLLSRRGSHRSALHSQHVRPYARPMTTLGLVIFNCDCVLVDCERVIVKVEAQICRERGWDLVEDDIIALRRPVRRLDASTVYELVGEHLDPGERGVRRPVRQRTLCGGGGRRCGRRNRSDRTFGVSGPVSRRAGATRGWR